MTITDLLLSPDPDNTTLGLIMMSEMGQIEVFEEFDKVMTELKRTNHRKKRINDALTYGHSTLLSKSRALQLKEVLAFFNDTIFYFPLHSYTVSEIVLLESNVADAKHYFYHTIDDSFSDNFKKHVLYDGWRER